MQESTLNPAWISFAGLVIDLVAAWYLIKDWELQQKDSKDWAKDRSKTKRATVSNLKEKWASLAGRERMPAPEFDKLSAEEIFEIQTILPKNDDSAEISSDKKAEFKARYGIGFVDSDYQEIDTELDKLSSTIDLKTFRNSVKSNNFKVASRFLVFGIFLQAVGAFLSIDH